MAEVSPTPLNCRHAACPSTEILEFNHRVPWSQMWLHDYRNSVKRHALQLTELRLDLEQHVREEQRISLNMFTSSNTRLQQEMSHWQDYTLHPKLN